MTTPQHSTAMTSTIVRHCVNVSGVPSRLLTLGAGPGDAPKRLILVIPGNPGLAAFYAPFMLTLKERLGPSADAIWAISHAGHEVPTADELNKHRMSMPTVGDHPDLFSLRGQIEHKLDFIRRFVPEETRLTLVGHSVGCYVTMHVMNKLGRATVDSQMLFPMMQVRKEFCLCLLSHA